MATEFPSEHWKDYELLDSGRGMKLERFGGYVLARPEPKALWDKNMTDQEWDRLTHTRFTPGAGFGKAGKEDSGTWDRLKAMPDQWWIRYSLGGGGKSSGSLRSAPYPGKCSPEDFPATGNTPGSSKCSQEDFPTTGSTPGSSKCSPEDLPTTGSASIDLRLGLTSFKHVGVFPEQAANWEYIFRNTSQIAASMEQRPKVLNLFAYTGAASLAARAAGADVTHLDSVRQVVTWAHENQDRSGLDGIRWVVEDAMKFAKREARRGNVYNGIILDPPAYGHGPDGEKWKLDECLFDMMRSVGQILAPQNSFMVLNLYSNGFSAVLGETVVRQALGLKTDTPLDSGELALKDKFGKILPLSIFVRLRR